MKKLVLAATVSAVALSSAAFAGGPTVVKPEPAPEPPAVIVPSSANPAWIAVGLIPLALLLSDSDDDTPTTTTTVTGSTGS